MMKKLLLALFMVIVAMGAAYADSYTIDRTELPETAQKFLNDYFPGKKIGMIKVDNHLLKKTDYDVKLVDGTKIEFSNSGKWTSVESNGKAIPADLIPKKIRNYIKSNFSGVTVTGIEKKTNGGYEIELSDGVELKFNGLLQFTGVSMDD